ncbi:MAG: hypothetical protein JSR82_06620 [Verrucomicrobia bacterium]|nr:hypothetical protein [Verrucomicrobiota bacterium]
MAFKTKKSFPDVEQAKTRLSALKEIDKSRGKTVNYGEEEKPLTKAELEAQIQLLEDTNSAYNQTLDQADALSTAIERERARLREMSAAVLSGAAAKFGRDSTEVEQIGGTRLSERKRPRRKARPTLPALPLAAAA